MIRRFFEKRRHARQMRLCREAIDHVQELVDQELPPTPRTRLMLEHLEGCPGCLVEADAVRALKAAIARCSDCDEQMLDRLRDFAQRIPELET